MDVHSLVDGSSLKQSGEFDLAHILLPRLY